MTHTESSAVAERIRELSTPLPRFRDLRYGVAGLVHVALMVLAVWLASVGLWIALPPLWILLAWLDHAALTRLHEAAHRTLSRSLLANEIGGIVIGTLSLTPLSVYRFMHARHHAHLGGPRDPEFWPYNLPAASRARRLTYAWAELVAGWIVTPALYSLRTLRAWRTLGRVPRARLRAEWALLLLVWSIAIGVVAWKGWWGPFVAAHLAPAWLAGTLQTIRKFTEHLGMHGDSILAMTRTVVYRGRAGRAASRSQLHVDHHGTHHRWARLPWERLPEATPIAYGEAPEARIFASHLEAVRDMLPHLRDPKLGPAWPASGCGVRDG